MSDYKGDFAEDATVTMTFNTFDSDGKSVTVTDLATTDVFVYKDGVVLADPDAGVTLTLNAGTGDGAHIVKVDMSSDAQYVTGADYEAKFEGITIDTQTPINIFVGEWSCQNRYTRGTDSAATSAKQDTMETTLNDVPSTAEFEARTLASADYVVVSDTIARVTLVDTTTTNTDMRGTDSAATSAKQDTMETTLNDVPTTAEFEARTIVSADYVIVGDTIAGVTLVDTVTTSTDMRGTDNAATEAKQDIIDTNIDTLIDNQFPDEVFVPASGTIRLNKKGTVTQLSIKDLKDPDGNAVDSTEDIIAEATEQ